MTDGKKKSKLPLVIGVGCLGLISMCCCTGGGAVMWRSNTIEDASIEHVTRFLSALQIRDYNAAFGASESLGGDGLYTVDQFQNCIQSTPLGDMVSFSCEEADVDIPDGAADVICSTVSATQGPQEITIRANYATEFYAELGFVWFSPGATFMPAWTTDDCAAWSGREYFEGAPEGRFKPGAPGYGQ
jgi:hypothetical protein